MRSDRLRRRRMEEDRNVDVDLLDDIHHFERARYLRGLGKRQAKLSPNVSFAQTPSFMKQAAFPWHHSQRRGTKAAFTRPTTGAAGLSDIELPAAFAEHIEFLQQPNIKTMQRFGGLLQVRDFLPQNGNFGEQYLVVVRHTGYLRSSNRNGDREKG
jgi:hypothetical protein